jgi:hypothetical protein
MNSNSKRHRLFLIIGSLLFIVALFFVWEWAGHNSAKPAQKKPSSTVTKTEPIKSAKAPSPSSTPAMPAGDKLTTVEEGDLKIDEILRSNKEIPAMARDLHVLVKKLNSEAQVNASRHLVNLTSDPALTVQAPPSRPKQVLLLSEMGHAMPAPGEACSAEHAAMGQNHEPPTV